MNTIEYIDPPVRTEPITEPLVTEKPEPTLLNRAQRRRLRRYIAGKARAQYKQLLQRSNSARLAYIESLARPCPRCGLDMLGSVRESLISRCECQAQSKHQCAMCGAAFMVSSQEYRWTNVCARCAAAIQEQRQNETASASAAQQHYYDMREWDDEQHRMAQGEAVEEQ